MSHAVCAPSTPGGHAGTRARPLLGTLVEIGARGASAQAVDAAIERAFAAVQTIHDLMSYHDPASDVSRLNRAGADCVAVHPHTWDVLALARDVAEASGGRFDVSIAPELVRHGYLPRHADLAQPAPEANWQHIELLPGDRVRLARPLHLDLGGIAKGYAVDCAIRALRDAGMEAGRVNAGGDLRLFGGAEPIHVRHPHAATHLLPLCQLEDGAVATSATYYSAREVDGREVSPLIDAATRKPCAGGRSVSVLAERCAHADALTKVVYADPAAALAALQRFGAHAVVLDADLDAPGHCRARASGPGGWRELALPGAEAVAG
ncbi:MAG: FAD:protein FMN transferase [Gammaproteobacteria bacterium]|nr:FAD:protein FMN transferase [Gammaproteobacteria bacterium]MBU1407862.1 FAD:protein FMN transferase [Gammaproteobacteria bacterium]MBU1531975.1 FAD:protein FMN transferase [Gammaproteobacteria bacterium]